MNDDNISDLEWSRQNERFGIWLEKQAIEQEDNKDQSVEEEIGND